MNTPVALSPPPPEFGGDVDDWPGRLAEWVQAVDQIKAAGAEAEIYLPDRGVRGNSHMLMMSEQPPAG